MKLDAKQADRAVGALLGTAVGDALGVPYEYGSHPLEEQPRMHGGGLGRLRPAQWSDDTEMAICIARVAATGADLRSDEALERIAARFLEWFDQDPPDVGNQTRAVLSATKRRGGGARAMFEVSRDLHTRTGPTAGNGSLMRTAPVALAHLGDSDAIAAAARVVSALTHADPRAQEACVLQCLAIEHAVLTGVLDIAVGLRHVDADYWLPLLDEAEQVGPEHYSHNNGWAVAALLAAWSAASQAGTYADGVTHAVNGGGDTDTVGAIAGALLGARFGGSTVPARWRRHLHGWPGMRARDLVALAVLSVRGGRPTSGGWPTAPRLADGYDATQEVVPHPDDPGVLLGAIGALADCSTDAVVSLCRIGTEEARVVPDPGKHVEFWLVDEDDANNDPAAVVLDAARTVRALREEHATVLLHCVHMHSRTPIVAAAYGSLLTGESFRTSLRKVLDALPHPAFPRRSIVRAVEALEPW